MLAWRRRGHLKRVAMIWRGQWRGSNSMQILAAKRWNNGVRRRRHDGRAHMKSHYIRWWFGWNKTLFERVTVLHRMHQAHLWRCPRPPQIMSEWSGMYIQLLFGWHQNRCVYYRGGAGRERWAQRPNMRLFTIFEFLSFSARLPMQGTYGRCDNGNHCTTL